MAVLAISLVALASAADLAVDISTEISGVVANGAVISSDVGDTIPVRVVLRANEGVTDAKLRIYLSGEDVEVETDKFDMIDGKTYSKLLSLKLPVSLDDTPSEDYTLFVSVEAREGDVRESYSFTIQRKSYNLDILNVEVENIATAGSTLVLDVVIKNRGSHSTEDNFVVARIPSLNIEKKTYFGDITPIDNFEDDDDTEDATEGKIYLNIPSDAQPGIYTLEVEAYNDDSSTSITRNIVIKGSEEKSDVIATVTSQDIAKGGMATYELILVNSGNNIAVYNIIPETNPNLIVSVDQPILTVPAGSSKVVKVNVQAGEAYGAQTFAVNVQSKGQLVKRVSLSANVTSKAASIAAGSNIVILTVVLAIIFVVLLVVLIVLVSRKPEKTEEFGESYY